MLLWRRMARMIGVNIPVVGAGMIARVMVVTLICRWGRSGSRMARCVRMSVVRHAGMRVANLLLLAVVFPRNIR